MVTTTLELEAEAAFAVVDQLEAALTAVGESLSSGLDAAVSSFSADPITAAIDEAVAAAVGNVEGQTLTLAVEAETSAIPSEIEGAVAEASPEPIDVQVNAEGAQEAATQIDAVTASAGDLQSAAEGAVGALGGIGGAAGGAAGQLGIVGTAAAVTVGSFFELATMGGEVQQVNAELDRSLEASGRSAGGFGDHIRDLASDIQEYSGLSDEAVVSAASLLAQFDNVRNTADQPLFDQILELSADLARVWGTDLSTAAVQLGRAFNDPENAVTRLRRTFPALTKAQVDQVAAMAAAGDVAGAQAELYDLLNSKVGDAAEVYGDTLPGQIDKAQESLGELAETVGGVVVPGVSAMTENVNDLARAVGDLDFEGVIEGVIKFANPLGQISTGLDAISESLGAPEWLQLGDLLGTTPLADAILGTGNELEAAGTVTGELAGSLGEVASEATSAEDAIAALSDEIDAYMSGIVDVPAAQRELRQSFSQLAEANLSGTWDDQAVAMEGVVQQSAELISTLNEQGASEGELQNAIDSTIFILANERAAGRITGDQFDTLSGQIRAVPTKSETRVSAPGASEAIRQFQLVRTTIDGIPRDVVVRVSVPNLGAIIGDVQGAARAFHELPESGAVVPARRGGGGGGGATVVINQTVNVGGDVDSTTARRIGADMIDGAQARLQERHLFVEASLA